MSRISTYTDIDLGLYKKDPITVIQKQGDNETRYIRARIIDNNGKTVNLSDCMVTFSMLTSKNKGFLYSSRDENPRVFLDLETNSVVIRLNKKMLYDAGKADAEIIITDSSCTVSSTKFIIYVEPSVNQAEAESSSDYETLKSAIEEIKKITDLPYYSNLSKSYAVGGTGTRTSEDTDNSKYYCQKSEGIKAELEPRIQELEGMYEEVEKIDGEVKECDKTVKENTNITSANTTIVLEKAREISDNRQIVENKTTETINASNLSKSYAVGGTGTREGEDEDNTYYYYEQVKDASSKLSPASIEKLGVVKPDGESITVSEDGTISSLGGTSYSYEEKVIGTYVDGKPLYQVTIADNSTSRKTNISWDIDLTKYNVETIVNYKGLYKRDMSNLIQYIDIFSIYGDITKVLSGVSFHQSSVSFNFSIVGNALNDLYGGIVVTFQYTKTTDS